MIHYYSLINESFAIFQIFCCFSKFFNYYPCQVLLTKLYTSALDFIHFIAHITCFKKLSHAYSRLLTMSYTLLIMTLKLSIGFYLHNLLSHIFNQSLKFESNVSQNNISFIKLIDRRVIFLSCFLLYICTLVLFFLKSFLKIILTI